MASPLDPDDWDKFREQAHRFLDQLIDHMAASGDGPVWHPLPPDIRSALHEPVPKDPQGLDRTLADFTRTILPYGPGNKHPRFFGWVHGGGTPSGVLAEAATAALNANCGGRDHAGIETEKAVIGWFAQIFQLPATAGGLMVTGTSMANLLGLASARHRAAPLGREQGIKDLSLVGYASEQGHSCLIKAFEVMGLGRQALRLIPTDDHYEMDVTALANRIAADRAQGLTPFVIAATAGSVNSGAFDDLNALADLAAAQNLWLHVDGAFGALCVLHPDLAPKVAGIERADSIAFDLHKWLQVPYDCGCLMVRDQQSLVECFGGRPDYLQSGKALAAGNPWPADLGLELSRGFRALKAWFALKEHGIGRLADAIKKTTDLAQSLRQRIDMYPTLEVMAPTALNIVVLRRRWPDVPPEEEDQLNSDLVAGLQLSGIAAPSTCRLQGRLCIRVAIVNPRTEEADLDILVEAIRAWRP